MKAVYEKELNAYFNSMIGYAYCAFILLFAGIYTYVVNLANAYPNFEYVLGNMSFVYIIAVPVLTMRAFADERRQKTDLLLYSLPMSMKEIVIGKFLAAVTVIAVPLVILCLYPLVLSAWGTVSIGVCFSVIFAFFLLGAALCAIGIFVSSLTESQPVAVVVSFGIILLNYFLPALAGYMPETGVFSFCVLLLVLIAAVFVILNMTGSAGVSLAVGFILLAVLCVLYIFAGSAFEGLIPNLLNSLSLFDRFDGFIDGVFSIGSIVFDISVCGVFTYLTAAAMDKRRWS